VDHHGNFENWYDERAKHFWAVLEEAEERHQDDSVFEAAVAAIEKDPAVAIQFIREHEARHAFAMDCAAEIREKEPDSGAVEKPLSEMQPWELQVLTDILQYIDLQPSPDLLARLVSMKRLIREKAGAK
jgi:hypothetical protein